VNKKTLFLILLGLLYVPLTANAQVVTEMIGHISDALVMIGGTIIVIGWIIAGILYLTSAGSPEKTGTAKKAMIAAAIGTVLVIVAASAYALIFSLLTGGG